VSCAADLFAGDSWYTFTTTNSVGLYTQERISAGYIENCTKMNPEQLSILFLPDGSLNIRISAYVGNDESEAVTTVPVSKEDLIEVVGEDGFTEIYDMFVDLMEKVIIYKRSQP
jgi:hypothetical protein